MKRVQAIIESSENVAGAVSTPGLAGPFSHGVPDPANSPITSTKPVAQPERLPDSHKELEGIIRILTNVIEVSKTKSAELASVQEKIRESEGRLLAIMNHSASIVMLKDVAGRYEFVNRCFEELFDVDAATVIGKTDHQLFGADIGQVLRGCDLETIASAGVTHSFDDVTIGGRAVRLESMRFPLFDLDGVVTSVCTQASDSSLKRHADEQLRLAAKVFDRSGEAIVITDPHAVILTVNAAFTRITHYTIDDVIGKTPRILQSGQHAPEFFEHMWRGLRNDGAWQGEIINRRKNGEIYPEWLTINAVKDDAGDLVNYVSISRDITHVRESQRRIEFLATHDALTGLPNRTLLSDRLDHAICQARRGDHRVAVLFIDLDNFKNINDSLGHDVGDMLLKQATERLKKSVRDSDTLARLGGDEFVAVLSNVSVDDVHVVAARIVDFMATVFQVNENTLFVSASIGISMFPEDGNDSVSLLKNADTAMYSAKDDGRNQYQFFANHMKVLIMQRMALETSLRLALIGGCLRMEYQPKIHLATGAIIGAEALVRWHDPVLGEVAPAQFIPVAEGCGLISILGSRVFEMVSGQIACWRSMGIAVPPIAINVSAHQLREPRFVDNIAAVIASSGVPAYSISIELTESALMERVDQVRERLLQLESMGVTLSVDDFGTGYSSLAYLRKLPIGELKVDRSFIDGLTDQPDDRSVAKTIIDMAHALGMQVVAEGVETLAQLRVLQSQGCDIAQGYLFYRPLAPDEFVRALTAGSLAICGPVLQVENL
ncbi:putative bifunctional diguanylate cyclase/phosphodiesterase [Actimicrobium antarcticum]